MVWSTLAVSGGEQPQVTFYDGQVRVVMKVTVSGQQKLRIYQSNDGGYAWDQIADDYLPSGSPPPAIFHLYAYSDRYGTHIVWDDTETDYDYNKEVYYVRFNDLVLGGPFLNFRNITELSSPSQGAGPKVAVVGNKACVAFASRNARSSAGAP